MINLHEKKIVFLFTPGPIGGAEKIVINGVRALIKENIDVELWVIREERVPHIANAFIDLLKDVEIKPKIFSSQSIYDHSLFKSLAKSFLETKPNIIHAHGFKAAFYAFLSCPKTSNLIVTHHGKTSHTLKVKIYEFIEDQIMKRCSAVIAVSKDMKKTLSDSGIPSKKITVVENFMTTDILPIKTAETKTLKLLFVGRLSPEKGCSILVDAMTHLNNEKFSLTILGDGVEMDSLQTKVKDLGLSEKIFFTGFKQNVNEYMSSSDAIVMPSYREGQPLTLIEACCMGLPVVASNVGGIPELVNEDINGHLCPAGSPIELSQALIKFSQNINRLQANALDLSSGYVERFSSKTWAKNTMNVYASVLSH
jgi:glycosyltransferase involved in cell wall biosynthesis